VKVLADRHAVRRPTADMSEKKPTSTVIMIIIVIIVVGKHVPVCARQHVHMQFSAAFVSVYSQDDCVLEQFV